MGERVTYRSRPRIDSFWGVGTTDTVANYAGSGWIGPFTRAQLMEFWFRVKKIRIQASCDWEDDFYDPPETGSASIDLTLTRSKTPYEGYEEITSELELLNQWNANEYLGFGTTVPGLYTEDNILMFHESLPRESMAIDENGDYWLDASTSFAAIRVISDDYKLLVLGNGTSGDCVADLTFSDGSTVPIDLTFQVSGATSTSNHTATIEITEWYPYADKAGDLAWDTATGLQDNGGPGG